MAQRLLHRVDVHPALVGGDGGPRVAGGVVGEAVDAQGGAYPVHPLHDHVAEGGMVHVPPAEVEGVLAVPVGVPFQDRPRLVRNGQQHVGAVRPPRAGLPPVVLHVPPVRPLQLEEVGGVDARQVEGEHEHVACDGRLALRREVPYAEYLVGRERPLACLRHAVGLHDGERVPRDAGLAGRRVVQLPLRLPVDARHGREVERRGAPPLAPEPLPVLPHQPRGHLVVEEQPPAHELLERLHRLPVHRQRAVLLLPRHPLQVQAAVAEEVAVVLVVERGDSRHLVYAHREQRGPLRVAAVAHPLHDLVGAVYQHGRHQLAVPDVAIARHEPRRQVPRAPPVYQADAHRPLAVPAGPHHHRLEARHGSPLSLQSFPYLFLLVVLRPVQLVGVLGELSGQFSEALRYTCVLLAFERLLLPHHERAVKPLGEPGVRLAEEPPRELRDVQNAVQLVKDDADRPALLFHALRAVLNVTIHIVQFQTEIFSFCHNFSYFCPRPYRTGALIKHRGFRKGVP